MCAIRVGIRRGKDSQRHTMSIHGQKYLGVAPPELCASVPLREKSSEASADGGVAKMTGVCYTVPCFSARQQNRAGHCV